MGARILGTAPPPKGTRFAVIDIPPGNQPHMHRTETNLEHWTGLIKALGVKID